MNLCVVRLLPEILSNFCLSSSFKFIAASLPPIWSWHVSRAEGVRISLLNSLSHLHDLDRALNIQDLSIAETQVYCRSVNTECPRRQQLPPTPTGQTAQFLPLARHLIPTCQFHLTRRASVTDVRARLNLVDNIFFFQSQNVLRSAFRDPFMWKSWDLISNLALFLTSKRCLMQLQEWSEGTTCSKCGCVRSRSQTQSTVRLREDSKLRSQRTESRTARCKVS